MVPRAQGACDSNLEVVNGRRLLDYMQVRRHRRNQDGCRIPEMTAVKCKVGHGWKNMNEYMLYHGTSYSKADAIVESGFDAQRALVGLFGRGAYFAQRASKSDSYTTCKECAAENGTECRHACGERCILVSLVLLGETCIMFTTNDLVRASMKAPDRSDGLPCDSISAACSQDGGAVDHMEFVVFNNPRMIVQFQVFLF